MYFLVGPHCNVFSAREGVQFFMWTPPGNHSFYLASGRDHQHPAAQNIRISTTHRPIVKSDGSYLP